MLLELRIENLLLIERAELRFGEGLNVITGETGAGKTVLAHSLDLLMGGHARTQIVRPDAHEAYVEGVFAVPEGLFEEPELAVLADRLPEGAEEIVLARRVGASGRTSAFVAGRSASAGDLRALGARLLAYYGQHEHRKLMLASAQLEVLDGFAGAEHLALRRRYREAHARVGSLERQLADLSEREGARERDLDLLSFELSEIEALAPDPERENELATERERLRHAASLREASGLALGAIAGGEDGEDGAASLASGASAHLTVVAGVDPALDALTERIAAVSVELDDIASALRSHLDGIEAEPGRLEQLEERLGALERVMRKHGGSVESVLAHAERCRGEIERLQSSEELAGEIEAMLEGARAERSELAGALSEGRRRAAGELEPRVETELAQLAMEGATLEVVLQPHAAEAQAEAFAPNGAESVELRVATNPGIPPAPLRDAASGGELSRVMLALTELGPAAGAPSLIFDEIDAGIGGNTARAVGERLRRLAAERQVICITHLPQVASVAGTHFRIRKRVSGGVSSASVERVEGDELVAEIVRMLGGGRGDQAAGRHARELLAAA